MADITFDSISVGDIQLHVATAGPPDGIPVLLVHGFPEGWVGWHSQIHALAEAGFHVLAPDLRGYGLSDKPPRISDYHFRHVNADIIGLLDHFGIERVMLAGHDWGGLITWLFTSLHPERVERLAIGNAPHPAVMKRFLLTHPRQMLMSRYVFYFQLPALPDRTLSRDDFRNLKRLIGGWGLPPDRMAASLEGIRQPGTMTAMLNYYRMLTRSYLFIRLPGHRLPMPTLIMWGKRDVILLPDLIEPSAAMCESLTLRIFEESGHFIQHENPVEVSQALIDHFTVSS